MVDKAWNIAIEAEDSGQALAGALVNTPSLCHLPGVPSLGINLQTPAAVSVVILLNTPLLHL